MNRIAGRAGIALLLVLVLVGGLVFFVGEYLFEAGEWINAAGSPHVFHFISNMFTDRQFL